MATHDATSSTTNAVSAQMRAAINEENLMALLDGDVTDPLWRANMRRLFEHTSDGPFDISTGDPRFDPEPIVVVTNAAREVLAKCGPANDSRSIFDTILFAAAANAIRALVSERSS